MKIPTYSFQVDYLTRYSDINPILLFAQKYEFGRTEASPLRKCYANVVVLIESGKGLLHLHDKEHHVGAGTLVYISAGTVHRWTADYSDPMVHRCAYFDWKYVQRPGIQYQRNYFTGIDSSFREELTATLPGLQLQEIIKATNIPLWVSYFNAFTPPPELLDRKNPWDSLKFNGAFQTFLHQFLEFAMPNDILHDPRITKILDMINKESLESSEQNLYQWASNLSLGRSRFHDLFKTYTGFTPKEYLQRLKLRYAAEELCYSCLTVTEIAHKYGYSSIHYFSKVFRNVMGITPTEYRAKYR